MDRLDFIDATLDRRETVQRLLDEHVTGVRSWHYQIWNLVMLELWHRMFIDKEALTPPTPPSLDLSLPKTEKDP